MLDAPCGDLVWMPGMWKELPSQGIRLQYHGVDIVAPLVDSLKASSTVQSAARASGVNATFSKHDVTRAPLSRAYDLVFSRDMMSAQYAQAQNNMPPSHSVTLPTCIQTAAPAPPAVVHLRNKDISSALRVFAESGSRYLFASTTEASRSSNADLPGGDNYLEHEAGHDVRLELPPWNLPPPMCASFQYQEATPKASEPAVFLGLWDMHDPRFRGRLGLKPRAAKVSRARYLATRRRGAPRYGMLE